MIVKLPWKDEKYRRPVHLYCVEIEHQPEFSFPLKNELVMLVAVCEVCGQVCGRSGEIKDMDAMFFHMVVDLAVEKPEVFAMIYCLINRLNAKIILGARPISENFNI